MSCKHPNLPAIRLLLMTVLFMSLGGCDTMQKMLAQADKPTARVTGVKLTDLNLDHATLVFDVEVGNPYDVPLPLTNLNYALASGGQSFLSGKAESQGVVPAKGSRTLSLPATISFASLLGAVQGVKPGAVVPYAADMQLSVALPAIAGGGQLTLPLHKEGKVPVPAVPEVSVTQLKWTNLSFENASATLNLHIINNNQFPLDLSKLQYALSLGGTEVANTAISTPTSFSSGGANDVQIPLSFSPTKLGLAGFKMLTGKDAGYRVGGVMSVGSPFGPLNLPFERSGKTPLVGG